MLIYFDKLEKPVTLDVADPTAVKQRIMAEMQREEPGPIQINLKFSGSAILQVAQVRLVI